MRKGYAEHAKPSPYEISMQKFLVVAFSIAIYSYVYAIYSYIMHAEN